MIDLKRPEVADKFVCNAEKDIIVHAQGYSGKISNITLAGAQHIIKSKAGYLSPKEGKKDPVSDKKGKETAS